MPPPTLDEFVAMSAAQDTESESSQESDAGIMSAASTAFKPPPLGGSAAVSGTNPCAVTLLAPQLEAAAVTSPTPVQAAATWLPVTIGPNEATLNGPIADVPVAKNPAPVEIWQIIEIFERGILRKLEVKTRVDCIPVRDWVPGGMAYPELYKGMQIDTKVFDFHVRIITIVEGPYKGDAFLLAQDQYRIAKGTAVTRQVIEKTEHCTKEGVERIVGPNIVQMFKFSTHNQAGKHPALPFKASKPDANWETYPHFKYLAFFNKNFSGYCTDVFGDTHSGNTRALKRINDAIHNPTYEQRLMQGNGKNLPLSERIEEVRENADGEVEAVLRQTTSVDEEGRSATVNEYHNYVTREQLDRLLEQAKKELREQMNEAIARSGRELFDALEKHRDEHNKHMEYVINAINANTDRMVDMLDLLRTMANTQQGFRENLQLVSASMTILKNQLCDVVNTNMTKMVNVVEEFKFTMCEEFKKAMSSRESRAEEQHEQPIMPPQNEQGDEGAAEEEEQQPGLSEQAPPPPAPTESIQEQHLLITKKRKAYQMYIQPRPGYEVMVNDIMEVAPKLYPDVFKQNMSFQEATNVLALACSGNGRLSQGRKKIKFIDHTFNDGSVAKFKGAQGFILMPKAAVPPSHADSGAASSSQDAADLLLNFANQEQEDHEFDLLLA